MCHCQSICFLHCASPLELVIDSYLVYQCFAFANMEHRRMFWLLLLVLSQPAFTRADCSFNKTQKHIKCIQVSLHTGVPLTTYMTSNMSVATKAQRIEFSSSTINTVPVGVFHAYSAVKQLYMYNVSISSISPGAFSGMTQLQGLYLNYNNISELQDGTFDGLVQLKELHMSVNKLTTLKSLNGLTKLELLMLNSNNIKTIDDGAFKDTVKLKELQISGNQLVNLRDTLFSTMPELSVLYLHRNYIDHIPASLFNTSKSFRVIYLESNTIRSVPCNELMGVVDLRFNRITSLVNCSKNIVQLDVAYNHLTSLPAMFFNEAASLTTLGLNYNNISTIHGDAFLELRSLTGLRMSNNRITTIPIGTFQNLAKLTTLDLSYNNLMDLKFGIFTGLTNLQVLDVSDNKIAWLESNVLFPLKSLTQLKLDGNLLRTFDAGTIVSHLTTLKSISLDRNQMQCDWLTSCINVFTLHNIKLVPGDSFKTSNVHGIYCVGENEHGNVIIPSTAVGSAAPVQNGSTYNVERPSTTPYLSAGDTISKTLPTDHEKTNDLLIELLKANSNTPFLLIVLTVAVIIQTIIILAILLFIMYSIKHINMKDKSTTSQSRCDVELLHITD